MHRLLHLMMYIAELCELAFCYTQMTTALLGTSDSSALGSGCKQLRLYWSQPRPRLCDCLCHCPQQHRPYKTAHDDASTLSNEFDPAVYNFVHMVTARPCIGEHMLSRGLRLLV